MTEPQCWLTPSTPGTYSIVVVGAIDPDWADHFDGMQLEWDVPGATRLVGHVADQAALQGILERLYGLSFPILSVTCLAGGSPSTAMDRSDRTDVTMD